MLIDCNRCPVRGSACHDCVVTVLFGEVPVGVGPAGGAEFVDDVSQAVAVLAAAGMLAPVRGVGHPDSPSTAVA